MAVNLKKINDFARQKKLALCMWYDIIIALQHEDDVKIGIKKIEFALKHNLCWMNNCFLCELYMKYVDDSDNLICTECPLERKYKGRARYGCCCIDHTTAYARVVDFSLPKEKRIAAAWEIVEAIKSV